MTKIKALSSLRGSVGLEQAEAIFSTAIRLLHTIAIPSALVRNDVGVKLYATTRCSTWNIKTKDKN